MYTLFLSTYNEFVLVAILKDGLLIEKQNIKSERSHSIYIIPTIIDCLNKCLIKVNDLNEIIVINGPGSFTGVRIGITIAKTIAYTLNIPIKVISSLECLAISLDKQEPVIITISDSKGKYIAKFENNKLIDQIIYLNNEYLQNYLKKNAKYQLFENLEKIDVEKIYQYSNNLVNINPHNVKPLYIKDIMVKND